MHLSALSIIHRSLLALVLVPVTTASSSLLSGRRQQQLKKDEPIPQGNYPLSEHWYRDTGQPAAVDMEGPGLPLLWFDEAPLPQADYTASRVPALRGHLDAVGAGAGLASKVTEGHPGKPARFFAEDEQRIAEMPPYVDPSSRFSSYDDLMCSPRCRWTCAPESCDQECEPVCAPPSCRTLCRKSAERCETKCAPPPCAVVCPTSDCGHGPNGNCKKCKTVCGEPQCTTMCADECRSVCAKPRCDWSCKPGGNCAKPSCKLDCHNLPCMMRNQSVYPEPGQLLVGEGKANLDPASLATTQTPPPPWSLTTTPPFLPPDMTTTKAGATTTKRPSVGGPVHDLKMQWKSEDAEKKAKRRRSELRWSGKP